VLPLFRARTAAADSWQDEYVAVARIRKFNYRANDSNDKLEIQLYSCGPWWQSFLNLYSRALVDPQYTVPHRHLFRLNPLHVFEQQSLSLFLRHLDKSGKHCRVNTGANVGRETGDAVG
jgi:hypothetical protein